MTALMPQGTQPTGTMAPGGLNVQFVTIVNDGDREFSMKYGPRDRMVLPPGARVTVVEEVAWQFTGRWWMTNTNRNRDRVKEYDRLRVLYGAYEDDALWERNRPHLSVYDAMGNRITTVIDDPDGLQGGNAPQTEFSKTQTLEAQIALMQENQEKLQLQIMRLMEQRQNEAQPEIQTETGPKVAPAGQGQKMADLGAAGQVPVAPPAVMVPPMPEEPAVAPGPEVGLPESTDGVAEDPEEIYGNRLPVQPEPIGEAEMPPMDTPKKTKVRKHEG